MRVEQRVELGEAFGRRRQGRARGAADVADLPRAQQFDRREPRHRLLRRDRKAGAAQQAGEADESGQSDRPRRSRLRLRQDGFDLRRDVDEIVLVLEHDAERAAERLGPALALLVEQCRGFGPFDRLGDAGKFGERLAAKRPTAETTARAARSLTPDARIMMMRISRSGVG